MAAQSVTGTGPGDAAKRIAYVSLDDETGVAAVTTGSQNIFAEMGGGGSGGTVDQGLPNACDNAWPIKFTDGTNCITAGDFLTNSLRVNVINSITSLDQGLATTCDNAWPIKFTDGTNCITAGDFLTNSLRVSLVNQVTTLDQGLATTCDNAWPIKFTDGTNCITAGDLANNAIRVNVINQTDAGGVAFDIPLTLTTLTTAYASGQQIGSVLVFVDAARTNNGKLILQSISLTDNENKQATFDFLLFSQNPSTSTLVDQAVPIFSTADWTNCVGAWTLFGAENISVGGGGTARCICNKYSIATIMSTSGTQKNLYGVLITRSALTYASTTSISVKIKGYSY